MAALLMILTHDAQHVVDTMVVWTCVGQVLAIQKVQLKGGSPGIFLLSELPLGESLGCPQSDSWWSKLLGMWIGKLVVTCTMVSTNAIKGC